MSGAETKALVADVSLGIGIAGALAAASIFVLHNTKAHASVGVSMNARAVGLHATF